MDDATTDQMDSRQRSRILLVDDDVKFCRLIAEYLSQHGFEVCFAHEGLAALRIAGSNSWDAVILDIMLPGLSGYEVLRKLREFSNVPVLMLTALSEETDRIVGLEIGADDYLAKSFSPREVLARLRAVLRRTSNVHTIARDELRIGELRIDISSRSVTLQKTTLDLTAVEFDLLLVLAQSSGRIKTREQILNEIRDRTYDITDRSIDVHVSSLRRKLGDDPRKPRFIRTIRSAGYMLIQPKRS